MTRSFPRVPPWKRCLTWTIPSSKLTNSNNVINKCDNIKTFLNKNDHRVINITKARAVKQNNDIKKQEKQKQINDKNKQTELYNEQLQKIKAEKKKIKKQLYLQQEMNELIN